MFLVLSLLALFIALYSYYSRVNQKWTNRGLSGPKPELLFGNLREVWSYDKPRSLVLRDWSRKYGKIYGFYEGQRPFIVVSDFDMINEILVKQHENFGARARFVMQERKDGPDTKITEARGLHWKRLRTFGAMAFTPKSLRNILHTIEDSAATVVDEMQRHQGEELDMLKPISHPLFAISALFPLAGDLIRAGLMALASMIPNKFFKLMSMMRETIAERKRERQHDDIERDFIDIFLDAEVESTEVHQNTSRKLSPTEIFFQCITFLLAGFDTTSNSLAYLTHFLANHEDVQQKLLDEVDAFLAENETIQVERLADLKYMDAVIKESLRHYPLGSVVVARECTNACDIGGFRFEVGDMVATDTWSMHMDTDVWGADAAQFRPERWLEQSSGRPRAAFQSFGEGPRICLGMRLAYLEEKVALLKLLSRFRIEKTSRTNPIQLVGSITVAPAQVMVKLIKR